MCKYLSCIYSVAMIRLYCRLFLKRFVQVNILHLKFLLNALQTVNGMEFTLNMLGDTNAVIKYLRHTMKG